MRIAYALILVAACKSNEPAPTTSGAASSAPPVTAPVTAPPVTKPAVEPAKSAVAPTRVDDIGGGKSFEIALPPDVKVTRDAENEDQLPSAKLEGGGLSFTVSSPEYWPAGGWTLSDEKGPIARGDAKVAFERSDETSDGWILIYKHGPSSSPEANKYAAQVAFPKLSLMCGAQALDTRELADRVIAICQTLHVVDAAVPAAPTKPAKR
jgi:hypothetical protein